MEQQSGKELPKQNINFDYDEFSFRTINQGLGFHQKTENPLKQHTNKLDKRIEKPQFSHPAVQVTKATAIEMSLPQTLAIQEARTVALPVKKNPNLVDVFFAYIIDLALVVGTFLFSIGMMFLFASFIVEVESLNLLINTSFLSVAAALFAGIYLVYFTILDLSGTPGKNIYKFRLVKSSGEEASIKESFVRALVCLLSLIAFFVPIVLDFHSKLSESKNIEN